MKDITEALNLHSKAISNLSYGVMIEGFAVIILAVAFVIHCWKGC